MYSKEHQIYLKKKRTRKILILSTQFIIVIGFFVLWQILANKNIINTFITSSPKEVLNTVISLYQNGELWKHIGVTVYETLISFSLGTFLGVLIATIFWYNDFIAKVMDPYLTILNSLPKVALGPIIIIWVGASMSSIILMALLISVFVTIINVYEGFKNTDPLKINLLKAFEATKKQIFFHVVFKGNISTIISCLKVSISMSLIGM